VLQLLINGVAIGCVYALVSCGFVLIYNAVGAVNFAQGELVMVGAFLGATAAVLLHWPPGPALLIAVLGSAAVGALFQRIAYYPVRSRPPITFIVVSIGMGILLRNSALVIWGPEPFAPPDLMGGRMVRLAGSVVSAHNLVIIGGTLLIYGVLSVFFSRTRLGRRLECTAEDQDTARLMGVRVPAMIAVTFVLSAALAAVAGYLLAPVIFVSPEMGLHVILKAFIAVVIGGFGSIVGTLVGGIFLGVMELFTAAYVSSAYKDVFALLVLLALLVFLPQGLFGEKIAEKA
jgi:branched-chain amino acid transport system permease protein